MLILPNSCFLHVPKTGGTWVKQAIIASGVPYEDYRIDGNPHIGVQQCPCPEKFKFAFVRHPVAFYRSYWQYKMTYGWDDENAMDQECQADIFTSFVANVLAKYPGMCGTHLTYYLGEPDHEIEFVGKYENLVDDLVFALHQAGEQFDEGVIRALPPCNVSNKSKFPAPYTAELEAAVREAEVLAIKRFGY